jgi:hypothetical protein
VIAVAGATRGIVFERAIESIGHRAHLLPVFRLDDISTPAANLLGEKGGGLGLAGSSFTGASALVGIFGVALMRAAFDFAWRFARTERRGGTRRTSRRGSWAAISVLRTTSRMSGFPWHRSCPTTRPMPMPYSKEIVRRLRPWSWSGSLATAKVGILWEVIIVVDETEAEAKRRSAQVLNAIPFEGVGAFISEMNGYDFSKLPARFRLRELNDEIAATNASPVALLHRMALADDADSELTREEFFERALKIATGYDKMVVGTAAQVADHLEEEFELTGSRGGFMIEHPMTTPRDFLNVVDYLVPELQRRGRYRTRYPGKTLKENLAI